ncbi:hypothetical protein BASA81_018199, partial [Batrachochytrium salamandrivorans]
MLVSSVIVILTIIATSVSADNYAKFNLLKNDRAAGRFVFPPTTLAQKEVILSNVESALTIQAGDELLAIDGLSFVNWFEQNKFKYGFGANEFGGQRAALDYLTTIYGEINRLPSEDSITFKFKSRANPEIIYTVNVPAEQSGDSQEFNTADFSPEDPKRKTAMGKMSSSSQKSAVPMNPTDVTEVTWGIYKPESANMGIIKLDSFNPEDIGTKGPAVEKAVMIIRSLLANELKDTNSVMYELRGNSGGDAEFANSLVQLSKPDFQPFGHRYLMNEITFDLFVDGRDPDVDTYAKAWQETEENSR